MTSITQSGLVTDFTASLGTEWYQVTFPIAFSSDSTPVVCCQIQTREGDNTPGLRMKNVNNKGFEVRMEEVRMDDATSSVVGDLGKLKSPGMHSRPETLGWIAMGE